MNADNADSAQRRRRRRAPFESSRATRVSTIPGRNSSNDGNARQQRLFSARAFTASQTRSPFAMTDPEHPSTSQQTTINPPMNAQRSSKNRKAHLVTADLEDEEDSVLEADQSTGDLLSDIDDIELGELYGDPLAEAHRTERRIEHNQPEKSLTLTGQQSELQIENASLDAQQQHPIVKPKLPQRFHQRKRIVPPQRQPFSRATGLLQMEEGRLATEQLRPEGPSPERAFSPALDVQLATEPPERKESRSSTKSIVTILSPRNLMAAARKSPTPPHAEMPSTQQVEEIRKKSSSVQNGSIGGVPPATFVTVPTPPQIRISSPQEQLRPMSKGTQSELAAASSDGHRQQPMNPSLIKGISKSISRFRNRNRILDADAQEQANFMSKFGMSGVQPGSVILPGVNVDTGKDGKRKGNWLSRLVFDTNENYFYHWIALVSTAYVYNLLVVIARTVFIDMAAGRLWMLWLPLDLLMDSIYLTDMFVRSRTGYLEQGLLVRDCAKIRALYLRNRQFLWDCASILPLDHIYWFIFWKPQAILRINRLFRKDRIQRFMEQTETRTSMPNAFRVGVVVWYIAVIIHWNACFYFFISETIGLGTDGWVYGVQNKQSLPDGVNDTLTRRYIYSFYWSTLILTTIGEVPGPQQNVEYAFVTVDLMCGVLIFATIVGNVGSMISNISAGRTDFQNRIDSIKQYMDLRGVGKQLEVRVIKWFDYLWANKQGLSDAQVLRVLPDKLQAEIAMHVHFETLRKVRIFQDCEAGLLAELVLKLQLQVFSPGDYVCRKGDIGREMYIVKRGMLQVVADDGLKVFATLSEGAVFGELSILNIAGSKNGNRRTANVRSVGYTDLFVLNKNDLWIALREYPEARKILINKGRELLRKDNLLDENAPEEQKTAEEIAEELQSAVRILQIRIARLLAEHTNTETKLQGRITYLEAKLHKYRDLMIGS